MKTLRYLLFTLLVTGLLSTAAFAQMDQLHGAFMEIRDGLHAGNQFRTTFYNDGTFGAIQQPPDIAGEWPINSGHIYLIDGNLFVGSEVIDAEGSVKHVVSTVRSCMISWSTGDTGPDGEFWTFLPLPGFAASDTNKIAMSKWPWSWPAVWPDKWDDPVDPGWTGSWNGYFGKDKFNADEESYFVADDYNNKEFMFYPDSTDSLRRGLGMRMFVRGFQWSNALVEDALFVLFDLENVGTHNHDKIVFGYKFGNNMGDTMTGGDGGDDMGAFRKDEDTAFLYDYDDIGAGGWTPVGYFGGAFLESPGNSFDGIDNDGDGSDGPGKIITEDMFVPRTLNAGDDIIVIDYQSPTFERTKMKMPNDTLYIQYQDLIYKFWPEKKIEEKPHNLVDDNLNGLIDESNGAEVGEGADAIRTYLYPGLKYVDYFTGEGSNNLLIDERRDDGIDNDGDWDPESDDLGADGKEFTGDPGEGDGKPTDGEPHFDKTDIDETDMIGLTSFTLYLWPDIPHYEDEKVWKNITPGYFDDLLENENIELLYGSGYFPHVSGTIERFSMGILCGIDEDDFMENKKWIAKAYNENYNFSKAPLIPTLTAIPGDGKVTLMWDKKAEESVDPITGKDFEGYRIYRSTEPGWQDMTPITDGKGSVTYRKPIAQFDVVNEHEGFAPVHIKGVRFWMGENTGIVHSWTDTTVTNGQEYYYAITSYDHGAPEGGIAPSECSKFISVSTAGEIDKGSNVVIVRPEAPSAGFVDASLENVTMLEGSQASGDIGYKIIDPTAVQEGHTYRVTFEDTVVEYESRQYSPTTKSVNLIDITKGDTLIKDYRNLSTLTELPVADGFSIKLTNYDFVQINADSSMWSRDSLYGFIFEPFRYSRTTGLPFPNDYVIKFGEMGIDTSSYMELSRVRTLDPVPVNFTVYNLNTGEPVDFGFYEMDAVSGEQGMFTAFTDRTRSDQIIFLEHFEGTGRDTLTWSFELDRATDDTLHFNPQAGDSVILHTYKPFLSHDIIEFSTRGQRIEEEKLRTDLKDIKVVPNPYVVTNSWEPLNPYSNGRGPRELHFIHLPPKCTIKIFNIRGQLIRELHHDTPDILDGTEIWDMLTMDQLDISYGVYIYHVDAGEYGEKTGKFAVIK